MTSPADITTTVITRFADFLAIGPEWDELFAAAVEPSPNLGHFWLQLAWREAVKWWQSPRAVLVRRNGRLEMGGLFAFGYDHFKPTVAFARAGLPDPDDLLWRRSEHEVEDAVELLTALRRNSRLPRIMRRAMLVETSPFTVAVRQLAFPIRVRKTEDRFFLSTTPFNGFEGYLASLGAKLRGDHLRRVRRLHDTGSYEFVRENGEAARSTLAWLLDTKRRWLETHGETAKWLQRYEVDGFLDRLLFDARAPDWSLWTIRLGGEPVAAQLSLEEPGTWHFRMVGHNPAVNQFAPGRTVVLLALEQAFAEGVSRIDMGVTGKQWKERLFNGVDRVVSMRVNLR